MGTGLTSHDAERVLVCGWFSFRDMGATAGDLLAKDVVAEWLSRADIPYDVAAAPPFAGDTDWRTAHPDAYSSVVFVCGPFGNGPPVDELLRRFEGVRFIGIDLTMLDAVENWNPFDVLFERDSSRTARPDLSFLATDQHVPVVGRVLVHRQKEYSQHGAHDHAHRIINEVSRARNISVIDIDTRLDTATSQFTTPMQVVSSLARMDAVMTTRLHGLVLSLKNGVPAVAVDPVSGGAKISRQAAVIDWPIVLNVDELTHERLEEALDYCLTPAARDDAAACRQRATQMLAGLERDVLEAVRSQNRRSSDRPR